MRRRSPSSVTSRTILIPRGRCSVSAGRDAAADDAVRGRLNRLAPRLHFEFMVIVVYDPVDHYSYSEPGNNVEAARATQGRAGRSDSPRSALRLQRDRVLLH